MTKRLICIAICFIFLYYLTGCSQEDVCNHDYNYYVSDVKTDDGKDQYHLVCKYCGDEYYKAIEPTVTIPENVSKVAHGIREIVENNSFNIVVGYPSYGEYGVEFVVAGKDGSELEGIRRDFTWYYSDDAHKSINISFSMLFNTENEASFIKEVLTATIMYLDNCDIGTAKAQMQALVNTYSTHINSELLQIGDWIIYFSQKNVVDLASISFKHMSEIENADVIQSDYLPIDYDMCKSPAMNKGTKFNFAGIVETISADPMGYFKILHILADDGNTYKVQADYAFPITVGCKYEFWVSLIDSDPILSAHKISPCSNLN